MIIDASLRGAWTQEGDHASITIPEGWMQGRATFGGLTAAVMAALGRNTEPDLERTLRSLSIQLLAPVLPGQARGETTVLRRGRNITFVEVRLLQSDVLLARSTLVFAKPLTSTVEFAAPPKPEVGDPDTFVSLPYIEGVTPEFTKHVDMRWAEGKPPFMGGTEAAFTGLFRYRVPLGDVEGILALLDTYPSPTLSLAKRPCPASTVAWTAHIVSIPDTFDDWFTLRYEAVGGTHGLHTITGRLYDGAGTMVAWTEQLVAVFG
ncbi:MAG: thioesterase family protein [Nannocystaceae bacterium]|nr:thioesterase family protein [Nannocystaceae bacterium]